MVHSKIVCMRHLSAKRLGPVSVTGFSDVLRVQRRALPVLPQREEGIRRGTHGETRQEETGPASSVETVRMHAHGHVEKQTGSVCAISDRGQLLFHLPLAVKVVPFRPGLRVAYRLRTPTDLLRLQPSPEARVSLSLLMLLQIRAERFPSPRPRTIEEAVSHRLQHTALESRQCPIIHQRARAEPNDLGLERRRVPSLPGLPARPELHDAVDRQVRFVPEVTTHRPIRSRFEGTVHEAGQQRQRRRRGAAGTTHLLAQPLQVGQVPGSPISLAGDGVHGREDPPGSRAVSVAAPVAQVGPTSTRGRDDGGLLRNVSPLHHEPMISQRKAPQPLSFRRRRAAAGIAGSAPSPSRHPACIAVDLARVSTAVFQSQSHPQTRASPSAGRRHMHVQRRRHTFPGHNHRLDDTSSSLTLASRQRSLQRGGAGRLTAHVGTLRRVERGAKGTKHSHEGVDWGSAFDAGRVLVVIGHPVGGSQFPQKRHPTLC